MNVMVILFAISNPSAGESALHGHCIHRGRIRLRRSGEFQDVMHVT
jgi:hypothetical protein